MKKNRFKQICDYFYIGYQRPGDQYKMQVIENEIIKRTGGYNHESNL